MMRYTARWGTALFALALASATLLLAKEPPVRRANTNVAAGPAAAGEVRTAAVTYGNGKSSKCYSHRFLAQIGRDTHITATIKPVTVKMEAAEMFNFPFSMMTGEGDFTLTPEQRVNLRSYLTNGGFMVASAGCSSPEWGECFRREIAEVFPEVKLSRIDFSHPLFHTVHDIQKLDCNKRAKSAHLEGLEVDGRIVLVFSEDGLNETAHAGGNCCCCGGNEIRNAQQININLLAYALTH